MALEQSKWIWVDNKRDEWNQFAYFRKNFTLCKTAIGMKIHVSASNSYKLYLNGDFVGRGPSPCTPGYQYYDSYEIILNNCNEYSLSAVAYNIGEKITMIADQNQGLPAFICEVEINYQDGTKELINSDESFKVIKPPSYFRDNIRLDESRISRWSGFKETYVSTLEPEGWNEFQFDDLNWENAVLVEGAQEEFKNLIEREIPFLHHETVYPQKVIEIQRNLGEVGSPENMLDFDKNYAVFDATIPGSFPSVILDFEKEVVGYVSIKLKGFKDGNLSIWYGETLDLMRVDTIIMNGKEQVYEPYHRRAFRYLKISVNACDSMVKVYNVKLDFTHYPYKERGKFISYDNLLNKIWDTSIYTAKIGTQDHYEDCLWREKSLWLGDARVVSLVNYWAFYDRDIAKKCIRQFFRIQREDGSVPSVGPQKPTFVHIDYNEYLVCMIYEYYFYTKDDEFLREVYPYVVKLMNWFETLEESDGLLKMKNENGVSCFIDWAILDNREKITTLNCLYYDTLDKYNKICRVIEAPINYEFIEEKRKKLRATINEKMFIKDKGVYVDCLVNNEPTGRYSQQTNMIAAYTGVIPENKINAVIDKIFELEEAEYIKGAFLLNFVVDALFKFGYKEKALATLKSFWGEMLDRGATTWWETFNPKTQHSAIPYCFTENTPTYLNDYIPISTCHAWGTGPVFILMKNILGIEPIKPGFEEIRFNPYTEGIDHCQGVIPTYYGDILVEWHKDENGQLQYSIEKPEEIRLVM